MSDTVILLHTAIAIIATVLLILVLRIEPLIALLVGSVYLGLAAGLGFDGTIKAITDGFGEIMSGIGLLLTFGVLLGSLMSATGALRKLSEALLRVFGAERSPYVFSTAMSSVFPAIYTDVLLVLTAPIGRTIAPRIRRHGTPAMGTALVLGSELGLVLVIPGAGALAVAGLLDVGLGRMLLFGVLVTVPTALLTMFVYKRLLNRGLWNSSTDELERADSAADDEGDAGGAGGADGAGEVREQSAPDGSANRAGTATQKLPPLGVSLLPLLVAILLIAAGAIAKVAGVSSGLLAFFGDPLIALFIAVVGAYAIAWRSLSREAAGDAIGKGLRDCGGILIITGVGGSLGGVISATGLDKIMEGYFASNALTPLLLTWCVAVLLHVAIGSTSVAAITAAGILAPVMGSIGTDPLLVALAAGSGALFAVHVNSNFFWMFQRLLGLSTRGTLKTCTLSTMIASVVSLGMVMLLSLAL